MSPVCHRTPREVGEPTLSGLGPTGRAGFACSAPQRAMEDADPHPGALIGALMKVRGFLFSRKHRVRDALLEGQVPGLHSGFPSCRQYARSTGGV